MDGAGNWLAHTATVMGLFFTALAAIQGVLALMRDTPESRRLRSWIGLGLWSIWGAAPGVALALGFPVVACVLGGAVAVHHALMVGRSGGVTPWSMVALVVMVLFVAATFTMHLVDRVITGQNRVMERMVRVLENSQDRIEQVERELVELRAKQAANGAVGK